MQNQKIHEGNFVLKTPTNSGVAAKPPTPTMLQQSPSQTSNLNPVEVETLKQQLKSSELTISELKTIVEKLSMENSMLKTRIDSQVIPNDVQL
jgi:TolA-binding protein